MTIRKVIPRERAELDIDDAVDFYLGEGGADLALRFIDELETALQHLASHPDSGSPRYSTELDIPHLRHWPMHRFPYLIFYALTSDNVYVWRVLHARRDIPDSMQMDRE
jgi:toxin ParE1/3/4